MVAHPKSPRLQRGPRTRPLLQRTAGCVALALLLLLPLVWDSGGVEMFRGAKRELALALWAALAAIFLAANTPGAAWRDSWWAPWVGILAGGTLSLAGADRAAAVALALLPVLLVALGWGAIRQFSTAWKQRLVTAAVLAGVTQAALALAFIAPHRQPASWANLEPLAGRFQWLGTLGNPGDVAVFLVLPALLALSLALRGGSIRWWLLAAGALQVGVILATGTLTAGAALFLGSALLVWRRISTRRRLAGLAGLLALVAVAIIASPLRGRILAEVSAVRGTGWTAAGSYRAAGFAAAAAMVASHPFTGVGFGRFEAHSFAFQHESVLAERGRTLGLQTGFGQAHNDLLQHTAETGVLGLLLAGAGVAFAFRRRRGHGVLAEVPPLFAAAVLLALSQFPLHLAAVASQWVVLAALAVPALEQPRVQPGWQFRVRVTLALLLAATLAWVAWQRHTAWRGIRQGDLLVQVLRQAPSREGRREVARLALGNLARRARWLPETWAPQVTLGNLAMEAGDPFRAREHLTRALALADRPEIRFNLAMALAATSDRQGALAHLQRAVELNPRVFREISDPSLARDVRWRLQASGYEGRHPWAFADGSASSPS